MQDLPSTIMLSKGSFLYLLLTLVSNMIIMQFSHLVFPRLLPPAKVQSLLLQYPQPDTEKSDFCLNNRQTQAHLTYDSFLLCVDISHLENQHFILSLIWLFDLAHNGTLYFWVDLPSSSQSSYPLTPIPPIHFLWPLL